MSERTPLQQQRIDYKPPLPPIFHNLKNLSFQKGGETKAVSDIEELKELFPNSFGRPLVKIKQGGSLEIKPLNVGVVFSGGQASGGHNVITGLFDALQTLNSNSKLIGFLGGPSGIVDNKNILLDAKKLEGYRNQGGFDLIASGRTKIETEQQLEKSAQTVQSLKLDGLVIIGGDDSNTNAAILAEYFTQNKITTSVIGVPKTIDGDLRNEFVEISFGFDTACRTYSEMIGNIERDALSAKKYYHFIKLMGRSASHIALECALQTHPNLTLIGEEVAEKKKTISQITNEITDLICERSLKGKGYGVILIPEGLIEFIPEMKALISKLNSLLAEGASEFEAINATETTEEKISHVLSFLADEQKKTFTSLPEKIQEQLLLDRDPHGNVQVSKIETEKLFLDTVKKELKKRSDYKGKFSAVQHFFGYEGRSAFPSNFDAHYCYSLGHVAALLIAGDFTGYMCCIRNLTQPVEKWEAMGLPVTMLMNLETRHGKKKPVIKKALVDLDGKSFLEFQKISKRWGLNDDYRYPGPIQFSSEKTAFHPFILNN